MASTGLDPQHVADLLVSVKEVRKAEEERRSAALRQDEPACEAKTTNDVPAGGKNVAVVARLLVVLNMLYVVRDGGGGPGSYSLDRSH